MQAPKISLWFTDGKEPTKLDLKRPLSFKQAGRDKIVPTAEVRRDSATVVPVDPVRQVVGLALVPEQVAGQVILNGMPLGGGVYELRHADRLDTQGRTYWISVDVSPEQTQYDPAKHSPDAFCFLTKARLNKGDPIVLCPGTPETPCGVIYRQSAWEMARQSPTGFTCPNCGFDPARGAWTPPPAKVSESLEELLQLVWKGGP